MSGAEVLGIISAIITIVDTTVKIYAAAADASGLPETFRDVAQRLPLLQESLKTTQCHLSTTTPDNESCKAMSLVLVSCKGKATRLEEIFKKAVPRVDTSRLERPIIAVRTLAQGDVVESLMDSITKDIQLLTMNYVTKLATEAQMAELARLMRELKPALLPDSSNKHDAERNALLRDLRWTDPTLDKDRIERTKGGLYDAASRWILAHPSYHQWRHGDTKLIWIKGGAGKGKTMLLVAIIKELRACTKLATPAADAFLSFFFCQNTDPRLNNAVAILKGLIYLLLVQDSSLVSYLKDHSDRMDKELFDPASNVNAFDALASVFRQMAQHLTSETVYLAVDALDECDDGRTDLLGLIKATSLQENRLKWIVTSRNHVTIDGSLALSLEVNSEAVRRSIEVYIEHKVSQIPSLKSNPAQRANIQQKLLDKADGTFLWVDLVLRSIYDTLGHDIVRLIDETPKGLPALYEKMMDRMMTSTGVLTSTYLGPCLATLSIATVAYRPLHLFELQTLAGFQYDPDDLERIVNMCGSFLTLLDDRIYPIHQSAKDYLVSDTALGKIFPDGKHAVHRSIVDRSAAEMRKVLRRDIYNLVHPGTLIQEVTPPEQDPLLAVGYSCAYWIDHIRGALQESRRSRLVRALKQKFTPLKSTRRLRDLIATFFQHHFLHWLEALSLLGVVTNGIVSLARLRDILSTRSRTFIKLVRDSYRFILYSRSIIEQAPLQIYISALLFAPINSIIRILFDNEELSWILTKPVVEQDWSLCLQILEGHSNSVSSVVFSPDGSRIASGSGDGTVRIWDAKSGREEHKLEGHSDSVRSVAFSPDGSRIASGSADRTVRIWDAKSGREECKLEGHSYWVNSVAFSPDGSRIASGSDDRTVRIWDAKSGREERKLEGYSSWVNSVAFSPDGSRIASGSADRTVRIWDAKSGRQERKLEGHSYSVSSVAFSPDGSRIASGSADRTVWIWDAKSGREERKLEGHSHSVSSVAFSPDGSRIASGSADGTVRIWDAKSGLEMRVIQMERDVNHLRFETYDSRLQLRINAGSIYLESDDVGNHVGDRTSLGLESEDQLPSDQGSVCNVTKLQWDLSRDGSWIIWRSRRTIWLPPDFRPGRSDISRDGSAIAIGRPTGRVVVIRMSLDMPL
ncbi:hypothetical protein jhhlp_006439 [Lomentospora prolificans]|uniref:NACHT domain-containing protein n=1 Tax=Lomentospora prolificans TaxID=41688 RepID=A0A2N3N5X0_9PEZI|nr:hypothetical protein jhhlp_006439 [Lomentospora prolificans]